MAELTVPDASGEPGDALEIKEVYGFGEPMLALFVMQEGDECGVNLNAATAQKLMEFLTEFLCKAAD